VLSTKSNVSMGVDLAREEREKKCDVTIDLFDKILNSNHLAKLTKKNHPEISKLSQTLYKELEMFIKKCKKLTDNSNK